MEQESAGLQYKVGMFVGAGMIAIMIAILLLGGDKVLFTKYISIHTRFTEVQGLVPGSIVSLAGIPVGNIKAIEFLPKENKLDVTMKVNQVFQNLLVEGTVAEIHTQGALGDKFIYLAPGTPGNKTLADGVVLASLETDYMKLLTDRQDGVAVVIDLIKDLHTLVASLNANGHSTELMRNMVQVSTQMKTTLSTLDSVLGEFKGNIPENKKLKTALVHLADIMEKVDQGKGTLGLLINDPTVYQNLKAFLGGSPRNKYMKDMIRETIQKSETAP